MVSDNNIFSYNIISKNLKIIFKKRDVWEEEDRLKIIGIYRNTKFGYSLILDQ